MTFFFIVLACGFLSAVACPEQTGAWAAKIAHSFEVCLIYLRKKEREKKP